MRDLEIDRSGSRRRPLAMFFAALVAALTVTAPGLAQDGTGVPPDNAHNRTYGTGWDCNLGFPEDDGICAVLEMPENAYATGRSYGSGWACRRGFEETAIGTCAAIFVPESAFPSSSGYGWQCERGYREERDTCVAIPGSFHGLRSDLISMEVGVSVEHFAEETRIQS